MTNYKSTEARAAWPSGLLPAGLLVLFLFFAAALQAQTLNDYLQLAGENNPTLQARYKAYESAMQRVTQAAALPDPRLSFAYFVSPVETRVGPQNAKLSLTQQFPWFGTLKERGMLASSYAELKFTEFIEYRNKLFFDVKSSYYDLYELYREIEIVRENLDLLHSFENMVKVKYENGKGSMADLIRVQMRIESLETEHAILLKKIKPLSVKFNALLHRAPGDTVLIADTLAVLEKDRMLPGSEELAKNPQIMALTKRLDMSTLEESLAKKSGLPQFAAGLDYVWVGQRSDVELSGNGKNVLMPMVSASIPIYRKKYRAAEEEARLNYQQFELEKTGREELLTSLYDKYRFDLESSIDNSRLYQQLYQKADHALRILTSEYSTGQGDFVELLRMDEELLKYKLAFEKSLVGQHKSRAGLDYILGK